MVRGLVAALVLVCVGSADAGPTRKVKVETEPSGASVYVNDKEDGVKCKTPCDVEVPIGEVALIIELENHEPKFEPLIIPKKGTIKKVSVTLPPAIGTIVVEGAKGATITVDDVDQGKSPTRIDTEQGGHHIVATLNGKTIYDQFVEVATGNELAIALKSTASVATAPDEPDVGGGTGSGTTEVIKTTTPASRRGIYAVASAIVDVGFRNFTYDNIQTPLTLRKESEGGQVIAGPLIEVWPGTIAGIPALHGLSLVGRFQFGINSQSVTGSGIISTMTTFWQSIEISARHRWAIKNMAGIEVNGGYVRDRYQFNALNAADIDLVPDVDYQSVRLGLRGSLVFGQLEPFLAAENRVVLSGGRLQSRFGSGTGASGLKGSLGVLARFGAISGRFEASVLQYSWDLKVTTAMPKFNASGASDSIKQLSFSVGYAY